MTIYWSLRPSAISLARLAWEVTWTSVSLAGVTAKKFSFSRRMAVCRLVKPLAIKAEDSPLMVTGTRSASTPIIASTSTPLTRNAQGLVRLDSMSLPNLSVHHANSPVNSATLVQPLALIASRIASSHFCILKLASIYAPQDLQQFSKHVCSAKAHVIHALTRLHSV